jgi:flavin-dependent thymidylate synthase
MTLKISLLDYTGAGHPDKWYAARKLIIAKNTRLSRAKDYASEVLGMQEDQLMAELASIANTIRSSWEFVTYCFRVEGISRATCDQMTRSRVGVSFAVMTQRSVDQSGFSYVVPETVKGFGMLGEYMRHMEATDNLYRAMIARGVPAQDARSVLPMAALSPLVAEYNLRALAGIAAKRGSLRAQGEYREVVEEMKQLVIEQMPWTRLFIQPSRTTTPHLEAILKKELGHSTPSDKPAVANALKELDNLKATWD